MPSMYCNTKTHMNVIRFPVGGGRGGESLLKPVSQATPPPQLSLKTAINAAVFKYSAAELWFLPPWCHSCTLRTGLTSAWISFSPALVLLGNAPEGLKSTQRHRLLDGPCGGKFKTFRLDSKVNIGFLLLGWIWGVVSFYYCFCTVVSQFWAVARNARARMTSAPNRDIQPAM